MKLIHLKVAYQDLQDLILKLLVKIIVKRSLGPSSYFSVLHTYLINMSIPLSGYY